jgi:leader peptidase (prepilin peptidase)/N-methyltransferase
VNALWAGLFGLAIGSFINVAIDRIPRGKPLDGRSACDGCGRQLKFLELVPVLSYIALRGRCSSCGAAIGARTPLLELACGLGMMALWLALTPAAAIAGTAAGAVTLLVGGIALQRRRLRA